MKTTNEKAKAKAVELISQFRGNAKYVVSEIMDEIKIFEYGHPVLLHNRLIFWQEVKTEINKLT